MASDALRKAILGSKSSPLSGVAALALREVAVRRAAEPVEQSDLTDFLRGLVDGPRWNGPGAAAKALLEAQVTPDMVLDRLIPDLAARLGENWMDDTASFAHVSLVSARLQSLAWRFIETAGEDLDMSGAGPRILMVVPEGETHTLGAVIAISILRREGVAAAAFFGEADEDVFAHVAERDYEVIAVSTSGLGGGDRLQPFFAGLRDSAPLAKVAIGGSILQFDPHLARRLGPDLNDPAAETLTALLSKSRKSGRSHSEKQIDVGAGWASV